MNAKQAKQIQLKSLLDTLGYKPVKSERGGTELKYVSPLRNEADASFNLNLNKNAWFDFGLGTGGNTLDFAIEFLKAHGNSSRVSDALSWLSDRSGGVSFDQMHSHSFKSLLNGQQGSDRRELDDCDRQLVYLRDLPLTSRHVLSYLENQRSIPTSLAQKYLRLVQYKNLGAPRAGDKPYYAFGMKNRSGGWEIRAASDTHPFKSALIQKDISIITGKGAANRIDVFEGMLDFISYLVLSKKSVPEHDVLILHSLSGVSAALELIQSEFYENVHLFLDNDPSGDKAYNRFVDELGAGVVDERGRYKGSKDVNKHLCRISCDDQNQLHLNKA